MVIEAVNNERRAACAKPGDTVVVVAGIPFGQAGTAGVEPIESWILGTSRLVPRIKLSRSSEARGWLDGRDKPDHDNRVQTIVSEH